jgi:hypothetical protein
MTGLAALLGTLSGCSDDLSGRADPDLGEESALHLGRVHVLLDRTELGPLEPDGFSFFAEASARFAYVRGFDEEFVRARADIPAVASDLLRAGQCAPTDQLVGDDRLADTDVADGRELVLLDAGQVELTLGDARFEVPVSLVPDLLPYMSGVDYLYLSDATPNPILTHGGGELEVSVAAEGAMSEELSDFSVAGIAPAPTNLEVRRLRGGESLELIWDGEDRSRSVVFTVASLLGGEASGVSVTCVFEDAGQARVDAGVLRLHGLDPSAAEELSIQASRLTRTLFDAGEFSGAELLVETRESVVLTGS